MAQEKQFEYDLTKGNVLKQLIWFAVPFFISNLIQSLYNLTDLIVLGHFGGTNSISAVNIAGQVMVILTNLAAGLSVGGTIMLGNYLGSKRKQKINDAISTLLLTLMMLAIALTIILVIVNQPLLRLMETPKESFHQASQYLYICSVGLIFIYGYNSLSAIMRGLGDSRTPMRFILLSCGINIVMDLILVVGFRLGAGGAAFATVFAQGCSMLFCIAYLKKHNFTFDFKPSSFVFVKKEFVTLIKTGLPVSVQQVATNFSFLILTALVNHVGGVAASAAAGIVNNFNGFAILPDVAISSSATAMISQNLGAEDIPRAKKTMYSCLMLCCIISVVVFSLVHIFPAQIFALFGAKEDVLVYGLPYIFAFSFEYVGLPFIIAFNTISTASGNGWVTLITNLISAFLVRIPVALLLGFKLNMGISGIGYSIPLATVAGATIAFLFYLSGIWKKTTI